MSLTAAMEEAYADPDIDTILYDTFVLNHPSFVDGPKYFVANVEKDMVLGNVLHTAVGIRIQLTGFDDDGETDGQITIDNISAHLIEPLRAAVRAGSPITVTYKAYTDSSTVSPGETRAGMILSKVSLNATSATGTLEPASKHDSQAFPRLVYDPTIFKALYGAP